MRTLIDLLNRSADEFGDGVAAIYRGDPVSFAELRGLVERFSRALRDLRVEPGDRIGLVMPNCLHSVVCYLGAIRAGAIAVPVNVRLTAEEMRFILGDVGARLIVAHERTWQTVREALDGLECIEAVLGVGTDAEGVTPVDELLAEPAPDFAPPEIAPDDIAAIIYTSGTTGLPKGAMISHGNVLFNVQSTIRGHGFRPDDVHLLIVPLFHVTGLNTIMPTSLHLGSTMVVSAETNPRELLALIERHRCTTMFTVPTTTIMLANEPSLGDFDLSSLRLIAYSGAPMPVGAIHRLRELFPDVALHNFYGLTETTSVTTMLASQFALSHAESIGRVVPELEAKVVDEEGRELPAGEVGELLIRGPSVFQGYYQRPDATAEALEEGWLHTGDRAYIDEDGFVFLRGRTTELIIVAGENVYPVEVENVLTRHPDVVEAAVVGVEHPVLGEVVKAAVVPREGSELTEREVKRHCARHLASFKVPQQVELLDELPRNPSGKVVKRELR
ncbi:MAG: long-chain-fatty-acid--CoA ligase [Armatimonadota bacterium]|nr:long-chain-fatty-acid--CoA ligase [Armatimonadota bacterium]